MSDVLSLLRHVYDVEPTGAAPVPGDAGYAEYEALRGVRSLLDDLPRESPSSSVIAAAEARAAEASAALLSVRAAYDEAPAPGTVEAETLRQSRTILDAALRPARPSAAALEAVLARAAEATEADPLFEGATPVEAALFAQSLDALDRLARPRPDTSVIAAVEARAAEAVEAPAFGPFEAVVARAFARRPQPRPTAEVTTAILARAAEAAEADGLFESTTPVEAAFYAQSLGALDRLPRPRPEAATLDAVRLAAATAGAEAARPAVSVAPAIGPVAGDRAAVPAAMLAASRTRRTPAGAWLGGAALVLAALVAIVVLPFGESTEPGPVLAEVAPAADATPAPIASRAAPEPESDPAPQASSSPGLAGTAVLSGLVPVAEVTRSAPRPAPRSAVASEPVAAVSQEVRRPAKTPSWEASDDVRALSLRLQELDDEELGWDGPSEAFGTPATATLGRDPGLQSVRESAAPARARLRTDSSSVQR